ncbi:MAG: cysteine synthase A [Pseudomonadales bacterium]|nr:cysteine synthase A [Pseudomonadales bacterium]
MARYNSILDTIGNTPLIRLGRMAPRHVNLYVKVESFNPMGSVKDRMARAIIEDAEQSGALTPGQTVIEATSGNTGIGLAMVCAQKGYPLVVTMAENFSVERRKMLRFLGAKVVLTPASEKGTGMLTKAEELAAQHGYFLCRQFDNPANARVHTETTVPEIIRDLQGDPLHTFVTGFGTGGTLNGVATGLRRVSPDTEIVAAEPDNAQVLGSGIPQPRDEQGKPTGSHPNFKPHLMQGWSPDFISGLTEEAVANGFVDSIQPVPGDLAMQTARRLAQDEGIFAGTSSGATLAAALAIAESAPNGANIVCMLPDTGERYLSTPLFADIGEDMNADELELSRSTQGFRFDTRSAPSPAVAAQPVTLDKSAEAFVKSAPTQAPVVMFALEWCEFCWSARNLLSEMGVEFISVDLDSVAYQADDRGNKIRAVLAEQTGSPTIPQVYVDGEHIGGCTELFDIQRDGQLDTALNKLGVSFTPYNEDPYALLPKWLHTRAS